MKIGIIAGNGQFPILFSKVARQKGYAVYATAHRNETEAELSQFTEAIEWLHLGQIKRMIRFFKRHQITEAVMLGGIRKTRMFTDVRPDAKAISLMFGMKNTHDDGLLRAVADVLEKEGITIRAATFLLPQLLAPEGCWTKRKPNAHEKADIEMGWRIAKEIGRLDIGQCVVCGGGSVLAIEAIDGTDATLTRGGRLGSGTAVAVKVCKPNQDQRFDMPAVGLETIHTMSAAGISALAVEAGRAVVFDREEMIDAADDSGLTVIGMSDGSDP